MIPTYSDLHFPGYTLKAKTITEPQHPDNPVLIFLHDSLGCITLWRNFPEQVAAGAGLNALIYERRGYGHSSAMPDEPRTTDYLEQEAAILIRVMDQAGIREAVLWGFSDGGSIALIAAARYPERIRGIIVQGAHVFVEAVTLAGIADAIADYQHGNLHSKLQKYHGANTDRLFAAWTQTWFLEAFRNWSITGMLPQIYCPVLVLQGAADEFGSDRQVHAIAEGVSGYCVTHLIAGAGHTAHKAAPGLVLSLSIEFIRDHIFTPGAPDKG